MKKQLTLLTAACTLAAGLLPACSSAQSATAPKHLVARQAPTEVPAHLKDYAALYAQSPRQASLKWFIDATFGMFICLSPASQVGQAAWLKADDDWTRNWHGKNATLTQDHYDRYMMDRFDGKLMSPAAEKILHCFTGKNFDANMITDLAVATGMKYIIFTTHHVLGRMYMFKTETSPLNSVALAPQRDFVAELAKACQSRNLGLFLYVDPPNTTPVTRERYRTMLTELLTQYGHIAGIWFDGIGEAYQRPSAFEPAEVTRTYDLVRKLQPQCLISFKSGYTGQEDYLAPEWHQCTYGPDGLPRIGKFAPDSVPEHIPANIFARWNKTLRYLFAETSTTMLYNRGYKSAELWFDQPGTSAQHKNADDVIAQYNIVRKRSQNFALNIGLRGDGSIHPEDAKTFQEVGRRLKDANTIPPAAGARQPQMKVEEKRLPDGNSELTVRDAQGKALETVTANLSTHHYPAASTDAPLGKRFQAWRYGAFLCYNSNQFSGSEHCTIRDPKQYAPSALDVKQWAQTLKAAGMKYAVLTTRHTSGFLLWDSPTSEFDVKNSGNTTDVVEAFVKECRQANIAPGHYYCMWGGPGFPKGKQAEVRTDSPRAVVLYQLHELATRYGKIPYFWIDMMNWAPADLKPQEVYDLLKNINPDCVVILNQHIQDGRKIAYFPTDILNGEVTLPPAAGHNPVRTVGNTQYCLPFEYEPCSQWRPNQKSPGNEKYVWFTYGGGKGFEASQSYTAPAMLKTLAEAWRRGASNILLSCSPDHSGKFRPEDVKQLTELGRLLREAKLINP